MKFIYWALIVIPGICFFLEDFAEYTIGLRVFGACLILIVIYDIWKNKDLSQYICKVIFFPLFFLHNHKGAAFLPPLWSITYHQLSSLSSEPSFRLAI